MVGGGSLRNALTSIVDENTDLFATFKYDTSGRAVSSEHAGGVERYQLTYNAGSTSVADPHGTARTFGFVTADGISRFTGASLAGGAGFGAGVKARTVDTRGNLTSQTDFNDVKTCHAYDTTRNLETVRVEGVAAATACTSVLTSGAALPAGSRKTTTEWHARWRLPTRIAGPLRRTTFSYNGDSGVSCAPGTATIDEGGASPVPIAVMCTRSMQATSDADGSQGFSATLVGTARASAFTYSATGQVLTVDGPRTDVSDATTYTYGTDGNVATITNAASHVTSITSYNTHGQPLTMVDPNGVSTTMIYDARQRLSSRTTGTETTSYDYDFAGQLIKVTLPDGSYLNYDYDPAHRLTELSDNLGNRITYTLDVMGNRTAEQVRDPSSVLAQTRSREYNTLNRLFKEFGAQSQVTEYGYDNQGNVTSVKDPLNRITANQYDALNRLKQVTDPGTGVTQYSYNGLDALTSVTDPRSLVTGYTVDGLGNLSQQASPDTGTTTNTYDAAGNLLTQTDAKSQTTTYTYDALNRVTQIVFHDGSRQVYVYDQNTNGIGRLSSITERDPANAITNQTSHTYDSHGRVATIATAHGGVTYTVGYSYDGSGRLSGMTYPSGRTLTYSFDALGRVNQVSTTKTGQTQTVVSAVAYHPFGGVKGYTLGNGQVYSRSIDLDGRIATYTLGSKTFGIGYDLASRIEQISDLGVPANINGYGYDALDRLTSATTPGVSYGYGYDAVGNRVSKTVAAGSETYTYSPTSNRIASITPSSGPVRNFVFDASGSTNADGNNTYLYDTRGRMVQATSVLGATNYKINALGQRIRKANTLGDIVFHYDTNGRLVAETDPGGALKRELIYLGDIPVGVVQ
jgi:YD repeat-containing protein